LPEVGTDCSFLSVRQLVLLPTGAGENRRLPAHGLVDFYWAVVAGIIA
jgi:hypothetical protein